MEYILHDVHTYGLKSSVLSWFPIYLLYISNKTVYDISEYDHTLGDPDYIVMFPLNSAGGTSYNVKEEAEDIFQLHM